jgi:hypothetical protein
MHYDGRYMTAGDDRITPYRMHLHGERHIRLPYPEIALFVCAVLAAVIAWAVNLPTGGFVLAIGCFYGARLFPEWGIRLLGIWSRQQDASVRLTEVGIEIQIGATKQWRSWDEVVKVLIDDRGLLCYTLRGRFFVPARAFGQIFPRAELNDFISERIKGA